MIFFTFLLFLLQLVFAHPSLLPDDGYIANFNRGECQMPTKDPLQGCPPNTFVVGPDEKFNTIQSAILHIPNNTTPYYVLIQPGNYTEQVNVTQRNPITLLGVTSSPNTNADNTVTIIWHNATGTNMTGSYDNAYTSTLTVAPDFNASATGSGPDGNPVPPETPFGNINFRVYNLDIENDYLPYSAGPSLAISISYANAGFYFCSIRSYQDTVYIGKLGNTYVYQGEIAGQTDFMYGFGTLWVQSARIALRGCGGGITAWKGTNTTFVNKYGVYIHDSVVEKANSTLNITGECALGRPWNAQMTSIFVHNYLDDSIEPSGFIEWSSSDPRIDFNTTMAEFQDYGPGFNLTGRLAAANITKELRPAEYAPYSTLEDVFQFPFSGKFGNTAWIDRNPSS